MWKAANLVRLGLSSMPRRRLGVSSREASAAEILHLVAQRQVGEQEADAVVGLAGQRAAFGIFGRASARLRASEATSDRE